MHVISDRRRVNLILPGVGGWGRRGWGVGGVDRREGFTWLVA